MKVVEKHSLWLRISHWANVPFLALMVWSGLLIYWANDVYPGFFPQWVYRTFSIDHRLAEGMAIHFTVAWLLFFNGLFYLVWIALSKHWRELFPGRRTLRDLGPTVLHDLGLRAEAPPQGKFNAAQRVAYTGAIALGVVEVLSGFSIYKPVQLSWLMFLFGGYEGARLVHFIVMVLLVLFFVMHVAQVARAGWNNFRAMVAGFEIDRWDNDKRA
jgi:thiosulfate reductase cytochrome b subunit